MHPVQSLIAAILLILTLDEFLGAIVYVIIGAE
jgi:hypothetical protein